MPVAWLLTLLFLSNVSPHPLVEWVKSSKVAYQRLSLMDNGRLVIHQKGPGKRDLRRVLQLTPEQLKVYQTVIEKVKWEEVPADTSSITGGRLLTHYTLTVHEKGRKHEVKGTTLDTLPLSLARLMAALADLENAVLTQASDINPIIEKPPAKGDRLVDYLGRIFVVEKIRPEDGAYILRCESAPLTYELVLEQIPAYFKDYAHPDR